MMLIQSGTFSALLVLRGACYFGAILGSVLVLKLLNISSLLTGGALLMLTASMIVKARHCRIIQAFIRSGFKTSPRAQSLCWTGTVNPRNISNIPAVGHFSPP